MDRAKLKDWVEQLRLAWENGDPVRAASLFANEAVYQNHPFRPPLRGRPEIELYWRTATGNQTDVAVTMGEPLLDGNRAVVEWWTTTNEAGVESTDCGALMLTFDGESCQSLREYWNLAEGRIAAPEGWGQ